MYSILNETDYSTTVNASVVAQFLSTNDRQLVTVGAKHLQMFRLNPFVEQDEEIKRATRLECIFSTNLMTAVKSVAVTRLPSHPESDSLLLSFDDAKLSVVNFNVATQSLNTISLHSYEDEILKDGFTKVASTPIVRVDPLNRCAAMLIYGRHLAILPFVENTSKHLLSYTISLKSLDVKLDNIIDMVFLHGYYEPTLLLVYEPLKTTAGRAVIRYDTVSILAVSLNLKDQVHAVVWNLAGLPTTISSAVSVPQPVGGVCLFGANEIIYLNQSVPPCGISLNSNADEFCRFPLNDMKSMKLTLDACSASMISASEVLVVSRLGKMFYLKLDIDISNAVRSVTFEHVHDVSIPHCLTLWEEGILFLGSRAGNSELLQYTRERVTENGDGPALKLAKVDDTADDDFLYVGDEIDDTKNMEVVEDVKLKLKVKILDKLLNVGPCKAIRSCNANGISNEFRENSRDLLFDLVTISGYDHNSALCFFQRSVRPVVKNTLPLNTEASQCWTIGRKPDGSKKYLIVSNSSTTTVHEVFEDDINVYETSSFTTKENTINVGELQDGHVCVQVCPNSIIVVGRTQGDEEDEQFEYVKLDSNFPVASASIVDPYILLLTQNGKLLMYKYKKEEKKLEAINVNFMEQKESSAITSACVYKDKSGLFRLSEGGEGYTDHREEEDDANEAGKAIDDDIDDEDALLYGESAVVEQIKAKKRKHSEVKEAPELSFTFSVQDPKTIPTTYWITIVHENGHMFIYNLETMEQAYFIKKLNNLPELLSHDQYQNEEEAPLYTDSYFQAQEGQLHTDNVAIKPEEVVMEIQFNGLGYNQGRPVMSLLIDDTVVFYEVFQYDEGIKGRLAIRLKKIPHSVVVRSTKFVGQSGRNPVETGREMDQQQTFTSFYDKIGELKNGLFINGSYPSLLVFAAGRWYLHPMTIDGFILSLCTFNSENAPNGFAYITANGTDKNLRIVTLQNDFNYDVSYPVRKVDFEENVSHCVYLMNWDVFAVITSVGEHNTKVISVLNEDKHVEEYERDEQCIIPELPKYKLQLFSTEDWKFVPNSLVEFQEFEVVTCAEEVLLASESTVWGVQSYLALGTAINYGEEVYVRGRILIFEMIEVVPEEGLPTTRHKLKMVYDKEQKGPVTSMCHCNGFLLTGMGQKIFIWQFKDGMLNGVSFLDMHFYIHSLVGFGSLALTCDMFESLSLVQYQKDFKALSLVGRDLRSNASSPMAAQFMLDRTKMAFVLADDMGNVLVFNHLPETNESNGGEKLILKAALNIGTTATGFVRVKGHIGEPFLDNDTTRETHTCIFATLDGSFGYIRPIQEKVFRRLQMLQQIMSTHVPQPAGLNPKGSLALKPLRTHNQMIGLARLIIDANLVFQYQHLSQQEKADFAKNVGSSRFQIMDDITELKRTVSHF